MDFYIIFDGSFFEVTGETCNNSKKTNIGSDKLEN